MRLRDRLCRCAFVRWPGVVALALTCGCGNSMSPTPASASTVAGTWSGSGTDSQGDFAMTWALTQIGSMVTGTVVTRGANPAVGTCASCHKNKAGTVSGTVSGGVMTFTLSFPSGGSDGTPLCGVD